MADIKITVDSSQIRQAKADTKALESATTRFDKKLDPLLKKEKAFATAVKQVNDAMRLGVATQKEAITEINRLGKAYGIAQDRIDRTTASMTGIRKNTNRMNATIQNAGYQFGDFAVQVQSGQNVLVAFSQQGAQLAGLLPGVTGAVLGVALVIGSSLARALLDGSGFFKSLTESVEDAEAALSAFRSQFTKLADGFRTELGPEIVEFSEVLLKKRLGDSVDAVNMSIDKMTGRFSKLTRELNKAGFAYGQDEVEAGLRSMKEAIESISNIDPSNAKELRAAIATISDLIGGEVLPGIELSEAAMEALEQLGTEFASTLEAITPEQEKQTDELEAQKAHLEAILKLERARDSLAGSIEQKFAASTRKLELMRGGMGAGLAGSQVSMEQQIAELVAAERLLVQASAGDRGMVRDDVTNHMLEFEQNLRTRLEGYMQEQAAIKELSSVSKAVTVERITDEERLQEKINQTLDSREAQVRLELKLLGLSKEEAELTKFIYDLEKQMGVTRAELSAEQQQQYDTIIALKEEYIQKTKEQVEATKRLEEAEKKVQAVSSTLASETVGALKSIVNGTKTASQAFRDMALNIIQQIMDILIWQPLIQSLTNSISGAISGSAGGGGTVGGIVSSIFGFQKGGAFSAGNVVPFANGGIVGSPTYFGMSGGRTGLMGEAGPEAIMPLKRGPNGKLGVEGGGSVTVNQTFQFAANGDESVKRIIAEAAPKIAKMTEVQIINSRQRGGQMRRAFG
jgi:phage-related minor tail protein